MINVVEQTKPKFKKGDKVYCDGGLGLGWIDKCLILPEGNVYHIKIGELTIGGVPEEWIVKC